jgi:hypothetical protein
MAFCVFAVANLALGVSAFGSSAVCPFCSAVAMTLTEQMESKDVVVSAKLLLIPEIPEDAEEMPKAKFEIIKVLRGEEILQPGMTFNATLIGRHPVGQEFFVMGVDPPNINWTTPMKASPRLLVYLEELGKLPEKGPDRLDFFQDYFEDKESTLAFDAYDEFAKASYEELIQLKPRMDRQQLIDFINNDKTSDNRRRLYLTLLGVCGEPSDADFLEELIDSGDSTKMRGLNALIACYLNLKGEAGVDLIERLFLANPDCEYTETMQAVSALRFHGTEASIIPRDRIVKAVRQVLDRKNMADMIVPDLARWEDWTVMDRLVTMFKEADEDDNWIRVPVVSYLHACPKPEAKAHIEELRKIDANSVARAEYFLTGFDDSDEDEDEEDEDDEDNEVEDVEVEADSEVESQLQDVGDSLGVGDSSDVSLINATAGLTNSFVALSADSIEDGHTVRRVDLDADSSNASGPQVLTADADIDKVEELANQVPGTFVINRTADLQSLSEEQLAQTPIASSSPQPDLAAAPVAATASANLTWYIIFVPMAISVVIFMLLWSVVSGWFERLIF